jgi:adenosylcobinamide-GDP ribazoletransferase
VTGETATGRPARPWVEGALLALTTFTVAPVRVARVDRATARVAMSLAPFVGLLLGGVLAVEAAALRRFFPTAVGAVLVAALVVGSGALLTRAMHLDGLADTVDGLGSYGDAARALDVMAKPDVGAFGVAALCVTLLVDVAAVAVAIVAGHGGSALVVALAAGRLAVPLACTPRTPAARATGLGAAVAGATKARDAIAGAVAVVVAGGLLRATEAGTVGGGLLRALVAVVLALGAAHLVRAHAVRRLGGITGDVLGALVEVGTLVALVALAGSAPRS